MNILREISIANAPLPNLVKAQQSWSRSAQVPVAIIQ
jgi:hypothetical protein